MRWLGPMLHLLYPPTPDPVAQEITRQLDERRGYLGELAVSRERLERIAGDPLDQILHSIVEDL